MDPTGYDVIAAAKPAGILCDHIIPVLVWFESWGVLGLKASKSTAINGYSEK
jgi:hypothetical protein